MRGLWGCGIKLAGTPNLEGVDCTFTKLDPKVGKDSAQDSEIKTRLSLQEQACGAAANLDVEDHRCHLFFPRGHVDIEVDCLSMYLAMSTPSCQKMTKFVAFGCATS